MERLTPMSNATRKNIGVIGLGIIGRGVAGNLRRKGFSVFVWNRSPRPIPNFVGSPAEIARNIFAAAEALKLRNYFTYLGRELIDDHAPLNAIGIPMIDIIDFDYPWWHTADDTMDKISAQSLQIVGSVALYYLSEFALE